MPVETIYRCWGCGEEKTEFEPSEDQTSSERIVWNVCPNCIKQKKEAAAEKRYEHNTQDFYLDDGQLESGKDDKR